MELGRLQINDLARQFEVFQVAPAVGFGEASHGFQPLPADNRLHVEAVTIGFSQRELHFD